MCILDIRDRFCWKRDFDKSIFWSYYITKIQSSDISIRNEILKFYIVIYIIHLLFLFIIYIIIFCVFFFVFFIVLLKLMFAFFLMWQQRSEKNGHPLSEHQ